MSTRASRLKGGIQERIPVPVTGYMVAICAFGREEISDRLTIEIEMGESSTRVCPRCLMLITVHRRYHHMDLERLIPRMAE